MLKLKYIRRTHYLAPEDDRAILVIKEKYGCSTASDAVRLALRLVAESPVQIGKRKGKAG